MYNFMLGLFAFVLNLSKSGNIFLDQCQMETVSSVQHICHW